MITCSLTENYGGIRIKGAEDDLRALYKSISAFVNYENAKNKNEDTMTDIIYGFLYEVRHAYEGQREISTEELSFPTDFFEYHNCDVKVSHALYYEFIYSVPELIYTLLIFNYFSMEYFPNDFENSDLCFEENYVRTFFSSVLSALTPILTKKKFAEIASLLSMNSITPSDYIKPIYEDNIVEYLEKSKAERKKDLFDTLSSLANPNEYYGEAKMKSLIKQLSSEAKKYNCEINDLSSNYPDEIIW